jgi:hypothetical protein
MGETRKLAAILIADVVGYSRLADAGKGPQRELFRRNHPDGEKGQIGQAIVSPRDSWA